jgi:4-hydroxy-4-methyl-2-oxoglutarate aldolase
VGFVTDGLARDLDGMAGVGLPVFCRGLSPNSPVANGPGRAGAPIVMGAVAIEAGDVAIGDADGVVIVPRGRIDEVTARLSEVREAERAMEAKVRDSLVIPDRIRAILDSDRIERLDK